MITVPVYPDAKCIFAVYDYIGMTITGMTTIGQNSEWFFSQIEVLIRIREATGEVDF